MALEQARDGSYEGNVGQCGADDMILQKGVCFFVAFLHFVGWY